MKPNCGNCDSKKCEYPSGNLYCYRLDEMIDPVKTNLCGCLHHPGAREYLMADVIINERERVLDEVIDRLQYLKLEDLKRGIDGYTEWVKLTAICNICISLHGEEP